MGVGRFSMGRHAYVPEALELVETAPQETLGQAYRRGAHLEVECASWCEVN